MSRLELPGDPSWPEDARNALGDTIEYAKELEADKAVLQEQLTKALREQNRLKAELSTQTRQSSHGAEVEAAFDYWVVHCGKNPTRTKLGPARQKALLGIFRLGFSLDDVKLAIDGASRYAYKDPKGTIHNDLELICRNEVKFQRFLSHGERVRKERDYEQDDRDREDDNA